MVNHLAVAVEHEGEPLGGLLQAEPLDAREEQLAQGVDARRWTTAMTS